MVDINGWLAQASIDCDEAVIADPPRVVDVNDRRLRRIFTQGRFDRGGRLFGGFWQQLGKEHRLSGVIIDGEPCIELDYGQMAPRIVYGLCGVQPESSDVYAVPGFGFHRPGVKSVFNALLFTSKPLTRMPRGVKKSFAERHRVHDVVKAIEDAHPAITHRFCTGVGHETQFIESQILVDVLLTLKQEAVVALPIHDAILVPASTADRAEEAMLSIFLQHTGVTGSVSRRG